MNSHRPFQEFLKQAHRRRLIWRAIEFAGIGLLIGCAIAGAVLPMIWWRGDEALVPVLAILLVSTLAGLIAALSRWPSLLDTTLRAEDLLRAPQLLSSALLANPHDIFASPLLALADARVRGVSPGELMMRRLNNRAWTGIAIAGAAAIVVAMMISSPVALMPGTANASRGGLNVVQNESDALATSIAREPAQQDEPSSADASKLRDASTETSGAHDRVSNARRNSAAGSAASGGGSGRTDEQRSTADSISASRFNTASSVGRISGNGDGMTGTPTPGDTGNVASHVRASAVLTIPPWSSATWPADCAAAQHALQSGAIPDQYRAMVREYFDPR